MPENYMNLIWGDGHSKLLQMSPHYTVDNKWKDTQGDQKRPILYKL